MFRCSAGVTREGQSPFGLPLLDGVVSPETRGCCVQHLGSMTLIVTLMFGAGRVQPARSRIQLILKLNFRAPSKPESNK